MPGDMLYKTSPGLYCLKKTPLARNIAWSFVHLKIDQIIPKHVVPHLPRWRRFVSATGSPKNFFVPPNMITILKFNLESTTLAVCWYRGSISCGRITYVMQWQPSQCMWDNCISNHIKNSALSIVTSFGESLQHSCHCFLHVYIAKTLAVININ